MTPALVPNTRQLCFVFWPAPLDLRAPADGQWRASDAGQSKLWVVRCRPFLRGLVALLAAVARCAVPLVGPHLNAVFGVSRRPALACDIKRAIVPAGSRRWHVSVALGGAAGAAVDVVGGAAGAAMDAVVPLVAPPGSRRRGLASAAASAVNGVGGAAGAAVGVVGWAAGSAACATVGYLASALNTAAHGVRACAGSAASSFQCR
jgi:hypothetical protein